MREEEKKKKGAEKKGANFCTLKRQNTPYLEHQGNEVERTEEKKRKEKKERERERERERKF
jgi:hypothetical protein